MCNKLTRHWMKRWRLLSSKQLGRLWITLLLLFLLCVALQILEKFQCTSPCRCNSKPKQSGFKETTAPNNAFPVQRSSNSATLPLEHLQQRPQLKEEQFQLKPSTAEENWPVMESSEASSKTKHLGTSLDIEEEFWQKSLVGENGKMWLLYTKKALEDQNQSSRIISGMDQIVDTFPDNRQPADSAKSETSQNSVAESATRIGPKDYDSAIRSQWRSHFPSGPTTTKIQIFDDQKEIRTPRASRKPNSKQPQSEKWVLPKGGVTATLSPSLFHSSECKPKADIVFLKVHKSASSTVMNILFRYGDTHNLSFALPTNGASQLYYPRYFTAAAVEGFSPGKHSQFNIMCHHMRFFLPQVERVMSNTSFYFSILRNPVHLMESSFSYYKGVSSFAKARNLEEFLSHTSKFYNASAKDSHYAKNLMTFDFGYNHNGNFSAKHIQQMLRSIEAEFDLLLISEYFDESMVLLKEALCWELDDVVSFQLNSRDNSTKTPLSESTIEKIKRWNKLDWELYVHFNRTFWEKIDLLFGRERMRQEVKILQKKRDQLASVCLEEGGSIAPKKIIDPGLAPLQYGNAKILGYNLKTGLDKITSQMCRRFVTPELQYSMFLYRKQFPKKALKLSNQAHLPKLTNRRTV